MESRGLFLLYDITFEVQYCTMATKRFNIILERAGDEMIVAMNTGGMVRARNMPPECLERITKICEQLRDLVPSVMADPEFKPTTDPTECSPVAKAEDVAGVCDIRLTATRQEHGVEFQTSLYDTGDDECPVVILIDEQLEEFIDKARKVLAVN